MKILDLTDKLFMIAAYCVIGISVGATVLYLYAAMVWSLMYIGGGIDVPNPPK
jgi:hypothetical protein